MKRRISIYQHGYVHEDSQTITDPEYISCLYFNDYNNKLFKKTITTSTTPRLIKKGIDVFDCFTVIEELFMDRDWVGIEGTQRDLTSFIGELK